MKNILVNGVSTPIYPSFKIKNNFMNFDSISSIVIDDKIKLSDMNNQNSIRKKDHPIRDYLGNCTIIPFCCSIHV